MTRPYAMWKPFRCWLFREHDYGLLREPRALFLECRRCGHRSRGWNLDEVVTSPVPRPLEPRTPLRAAPVVRVVSRTPELEVVAPITPNQHSKPQYPEPRTAAIGLRLLLADVGTSSVSVRHVAARRRFDAGDKAESLRLTFAYVENSTRHARLPIEAGARAQIVIDSAVG